MATRMSPPEAGSLGSASGRAPTAAERAALLALHRWPWLISAALVALPVLFSAAMSLYQHHRWDQVLRTGVRAPAEVVSARHYPRATDYVRVALPLPDGRLVVAGTPVSDAGAHPVGSTEVVVYDHLDPHRVRTVYGWAPPYTLEPVFVGCLGVLLVWFLWHAWRWPRCLWSMVNGSDRRTMAVRVLHQPGRAPTSWMLLAEPGAPAGDRQQLALQLGAGQGLQVPGTEIEVRGRPRRNAMVVVEGPDGLIWPRRRLHRPNRSLRRAAAVDWPAIEASAGPAPGLREPLIAVPPGLFEEDRPTRPSRNLSRAGALVFAAITVSLPIVLPAVVESGRRACAAPPTAGTGDLAPVAADGMPSLLPTELPGLSVLYEQPQGLGDFPNPPTQLALVDADFEYGFARVYETGRTTVKTEVFQFSSGAGPARYEAQRLASLCTLAQHRLAVPAGSGASAVSTGKGGEATRRMTVIRGSRDFVINVTGPHLVDEMALLDRVLATAR